MCVLLTRAWAYICLAMEYRNIVIGCWAQNIYFFTLDSIILYFFTIEFKGMYVFTIDFIDRELFTIDFTSISFL